MTLDILNPHHTHILLNLLSVFSSGFFFSFFLLLLLLSCPFSWSYLGASKELTSLSIEYRIHDLCCLFRIPQTIKWESPYILLIFWVLFLFSSVFQYSVRKCPSQCNLWNRFWKLKPLICYLFINTRRDPRDQEIHSLKKRTNIHKLILVRTEK